MNGKRAGLAPPDATGMFSGRRLSKSYGPLRALRSVDFDIAGGEIHGLVGSNGSGKSTLIKMISGIETGDPGGELRIASKVFSTEDYTSDEAHKNGVRVVHQDLGVFPKLTIADNLCLGGGYHTTRTGRIPIRRTNERIRSLMERFNIPGTPTTPVGALSRAAQTQVAIARAFQDRGDHHQGLLVLDEPSAALPRHEVDMLLKVLQGYAALGQSILYVSHRLEEILEITTRVTCLRDGSIAGTWRTRDLDMSRLIETIVGRKVRESARPPRMHRNEPDIAVLEVKNLACGPLRGVNLTVAAGEIVGVAGLLGSGRSELLRAIYGDLAIDDGEVLLHGREVRFMHPRAAMRAGIAFVPEDRLQDGAFLNLPTFRNDSAGVISQYWRRMRMDTSAMRSDSRELSRKFGIRTASEALQLGSLSGGNQQKVIMARWLRRSPRLLLLDEPTQGVDVGARAEIYGHILQAVAAGAAVLVVASDLEELARVADRVIVLRQGVIVASVRPPALNALSLTELSHGGTA